MIVMAGDYWVPQNSTVGINTPANFNEQINVYPNPSSGDFTIELSKNVTQVKVINSIGEIIQNEKTDNKTELDLKLTESGIYFICAITNQSTFTKKIIVSK